MSSLVGHWGSQKKCTHSSQCIVSLRWKVQHAGFKTNLQLQSNKEINTAAAFPLKVQIRKNLTSQNNSQPLYKGGWKFIRATRSMHLSICLLAFAMSVGYASDSKLMHYPFNKLWATYTIFSKVPVIEVTQHTQIVTIPGCPKPALIVKFSKPIRVSLTCCGCWGYYLGCAVVTSFVQ